MNDFNRTMGATRTMDMSTDAGLRAFMLGVYNKLAMGLALAGGLAFFVGTNSAAMQFFMTPPVVYAIMFGPIALIIGSSFFMKNPSPTGSAILYWSIVSLIGVGLSAWVFQASIGSANVTFTMIAKAFFITASAFVALSLFGYTTKRTLGPIGTFAIMGIWGVVAISVLGFFFGGFESGGMMMNLIMGAIFVLSAAITAWQTQELKEGYYSLAGNQRGMAVMTNWGALNFFISFVNMFQTIMYFMSSD